MTVLHKQCYVLAMPLMAPDVAERLSVAIKRCGELVGGIGGLQAQGRIRAHAHPELQQVLARFERINQTLEKAVAAGHLTAAQQRSIASNFEAIGEVLEKGAGAER